MLTARTALSAEEVEDLRQEYSCGEGIEPGVVNRNLRRAALAGNVAAKKRWLSKLSWTKRRDVLSLEKRADKDPQWGHLQAAFDRLLPFPGLWPSFQVGTLHRILSLRCPEASTR